MLNHEGYDVPKMTLNSIDRYVEERIRTGDFLRNVLSNDLTGAFAKADEFNREAMFEIVRYCWNEIPGSCWGSPEAYRNWLNPKGDQE